MSAKLLTETADYDTPGSWGTASNGWPEFHDPNEEIRMRVIRENLIPYGSYVTVGDKLRVHATYYGAVKAALEQQPKGDVVECGGCEVSATTKRRNMRTLKSALELSFRQLRRNQETLSYADKLRYWGELLSHCDQEEDDAAEVLKEVRRNRKAGAP